MQDAAGAGASIPSDDRDDNYQAIVSDLMALIEHVQASMKRIESAVAGESPLGNQEMAADVIVLDDVTPRYIRASAALNTCNVKLGAALDFLLDTRTSEHRSGTPAEYSCGPVGLIGHA